MRRYASLFKSYYFHIFRQSTEPSWPLWPPWLSPLTWVRGCLNMSQVSQLLGTDQWNRLTIGCPSRQYYHIARSHPPSGWWSSLNYARPTSLSTSSPKQLPTHTAWLSEILNSASAKSEMDKLSDHTKQFVEKYTTTISLVSLGIYSDSKEEANHVSNSTCVRETMMTVAHIVRKQRCGCRHGVTLSDGWLNVTLTIVSVNWEILLYSMLYCSFE